MSTAAELIEVLVASPVGQLVATHGTAGGRVLALIGGGALALQVVATLIRPGDFTHFVVAVFLGVAVGIVWTTEIPLEASSDVLERLPDVRNYIHRSVLYGCVALITLGRDWKPFGRAASGALLFSSAIYAAVWFLQKYKRSQASSRLTATTGRADALLRDEGISDRANPTGFLRFDEDSPVP